jgi:hypothetical protein
MFLNIRAYQDGSLAHEINPYAQDAGTLKGLPKDYSPASPPLTENESFQDDLVYEAQPTSTLTGEEKTFHFALATGRYKDNRIPPKGFLVESAAERLVQPVMKGKDALDYFTSEEYAGGYDAVTVQLPPGADRVEVRLYYQTTSREYVEFLRDEINGNASTLASPTPSGEDEAYIAQKDPFFDRLRAWGDTIWKLWDRNKDVPGAAPVLMTSTEVSP